MQTPKNTGWNEQPTDQFRSRSADYRIYVLIHARRQRLCNSLDSTGCCLTAPSFRPYRSVIPALSRNPETYLHRNVSYPRLPGFPRKREWQVWARILPSTLNSYESLDAVMEGAETETTGVDARGHGMPSFGQGCGVRRARRVLPLVPTIWAAHTVQMDANDSPADTRNAPM